MEYKYEFTEFIPDKLEDGVLYISIPYATASHKCPCGCEQEIVTPLSPTDWNIVFNGVSVSLYPSIGNWSLECRSHYWIRKNKVVWAEAWTDDEVDQNRDYDKRAKKFYYGEVDSDNSESSNDEKVDNGQKNWMKFLKSIFS